MLAGVRVVSRIIDACLKTLRAGARGDYLCGVISSAARK